MNPKKRGVKAQYVYKCSHRYDWYMNKLGKLKVNNHVKNIDNGKSS